MEAFHCPSCNASAPALLPTICANCLELLRRAELQGLVVSTELDVRRVIEFESPNAPAGYAFEFFGRVPSRSNPPDPDALLWGVHELQLDGTVLDYFIECWIARAMQRSTHEPARLWAEATWSPQDGLEMAIHGFQHFPRATEITAAQRVAEWLQHALKNGGGRPEGTGMFAEETAESMREKVITAMVSLLKSRRRIAQPAVAEALHCSEKTLRDTLKPLRLQGAQWTAMQTEAQRRNDSR